LRPVRQNALPPPIDLSTRQEQIFALFRQHGSMTIDALASRSAIAPQTIHPDINTLCETSARRRTAAGADSRAW